MSRFSFVEWIDDDHHVTDREPGVTYWRPDVPRNIGTWASLDLRSYGVPGSFVYMGERASALPNRLSRFDLGERMDEPFSAQLANALGNKLGIEVVAGTTGWELMAQLAGSKLPTREVRPGVFRRRIRLLDQEYEAAPIIRGGATDDFNRSDGGLGSNWTTVNAAMAISGNKVVIGANPSSMYWNADSFGNDHYSQIDGTLSVSGYYMVSALVRASPANGAEFYFARLCGSCGDVAVGKRVGFSQSEFASGGSISTSVPVTVTLKLEIIGSDIEAFIGGVSTVTTSDTELASGSGPGIHIATSNTTDASIDNWVGGSSGGGSNANIAASTITRSVVVNAPTITRTATITPSVIARSVVVNAPTITRTATFTPSTIARSVVVNAATIIILSVPILLTPADDAFVNLTDGETFTWSHEGPGAQATFAFRRKTPTGGWKYWNGTGWQDAEIYITSSTESLTIPAGDW